MNKFSKILTGVWVCLAILSFVCAFFCPLIPKIIGIVFGSLNIITILSVVIAYFQGVYYKKKIDEEIENGLQLQEGQEESNA